jgi:hypothetical protein
MEARLPLAQRTELVCRRTALMAPRQLDLVLDDVRFRAMTPTERRAVLRAMARLEAGGVATPEVSDDNVLRSPSGSCPPAQGGRLCPPVDATAGSIEPGKPEAPVRVG